MTATLHEPRDTCAVDAAIVATAVMVPGEMGDVAVIGARPALTAIAALAEQRDNLTIMGSVAFLTQAALAPMERADGIAIGQSSDFIRRRTATGVFRWFDFDSLAQLGTSGPLGNTSTDSFGYAMGTGPNATTPSIDVLRGALHFTVANGSSNDGPGKWQTKFSDDGSRVFRSNCSFYAQFAFEHDGYYSAGAAGVGYGAKFAYLGGENVGSTSEFSILVMPVYYASGLPYVYHYLPSIGTYVLGPYDAGIGANDIQTACPYPYSAGTCIQIPANKRVYFQIGVQLGNFTTGTINGQTYDAVEGAVQMWITIDGVTTQIVNWASSQANQYPLMTDPNHSGNAFSRLMFDAYQTSKDPAVSNPTYNQYYDELILSTARIPDPGYSPAWLPTVRRNTITDISNGSTQSSAFVAAGYYLDGWTGDKGNAFWNLTAWGGGVFMPALGIAGSLCVGANGHEAIPASTVSAFDVWTASWSVVGVPQLHRQVTPSFTAPPTDAEIWWNPTRTGVTDMTSFSYNGLLGRSAVAARYQDTAVGVATPWCDGSYSFKSYPPTYGLRYQTNVGSGMRYDNYVCIPQAYGGEAAGTLVFVAPIVSHDTEGTYEFGTHWTWRYGATTQTWLAHSTNKMTDTGANAAHGAQANCAHSEKYNKIFVASQNYNHMGCYDVATNAHVAIDCAVVWGHFPEESKAIITHGHAAHLYICVGNTFGFYGPSERFLFVADLDEVMLGSSSNYAVTNTGAGHGFPLLTPAIDWNGGDVAGYSMAWFRSRQKLVLFKAPRGISDGATTQITASGRARIAPIDSGLIHIITIPTSWKTQAWTVETVPITLGAGSTGVYTGSVGKPYGRFCALENLDLALYIGAPDEGLPAQIIDVFGVGS